MNYESDTPETDIECFIYEGDYVPASFARQLERERDEARKERNAALSDRDAWARLCGAVDCYTPSTAEPYEALKIQLDEARKKLEQSEIFRDEIYEAAKSENERHIATALDRDELRAEVERAEAKTAAMNTKTQRPTLLAAAHWLGPCPTCKAEAKYNLAERPTKCRMCGEVIPDTRTFQQRKTAQYATRNWA